MSPNPAPRLLWADLLKILSIYAVILIHSAAPLLLTWKEGDADGWWVGNLYDSLARWCIPMFFMISGALLIPGAGSTSIPRFLSRHVIRIGIPFLVWSAIYFAWQRRINAEQLPWRSFFPVILREPAYYHLWFLYVLFGLYLLAPIIAAYLNDAGRKRALYFVAIWLVFGSILPTIEAWRGVRFFIMPSAADSVFRYVGFFVLGYLLRPVRYGIKGMSVLLLLFLLGFGFTLYGTWYLTAHRGEGTFSATLYEYYSPNVILMAVSLFLLVKSVRLPAAVRGRAFAAEFLGFSARCVLGIYLSHALVIALLKQGLAGPRFTLDSFDPLTGVPLFALVVFSLSFAGVAVIRLIPGIRRLIS